MKRAPPACSGDEDLGQQGRVHAEEGEGEDVDGDEGIDGEEEDQEGGDVKELDLVFGVWSRENWFEAIAVAKNEQFGVKIHELVEVTKQEEVGAEILELLVAKKS